MHVPACSDSNGSRIVLSLELLPWFGHVRTNWTRQGSNGIELQLADHIRPTRYID